MAAINLQKISFSQIFLATGFLFIFDRLTKYLAIFLPNEGIFYLPKAGFKLYFNPAIAFSLPLAQTAAILIASLIIVILISFWLKYYFAGRYLFLWPIALVIIGAISNLFDRFKFEAVIDFIDVWFFPAFNLADCYILIGIIWLVVLAKRLKME